MSSPTPPFTIKRQRLFDQVAQHLEAMILSGEVGVGDALPSERELMERFGVGRPAIREALITLHRSGLIEIANGARARVAVPQASGVASWKCVAWYYSATAKSVRTTSSTTDETA